MLEKCFKTTPKSPTYVSSCYQSYIIARYCQQLSTGRLYARQLCPSRVRYVIRLHACVLLMPLLMVLLSLLYYTGMAISLSKLLPHMLHVAAVASAVCCYRCCCDATAPLVLLSMLILRPPSLLWCWYKHNGTQNYSPLFVMVDVRVPLRAACVFVPAATAVVHYRYPFSADDVGATAVTLLFAAAGSLSMLLPPPLSLLSQLLQVLLRFLLPPLMLYP